MNNKKRMSLDYIYLPAVTIFSSLVSMAYGILSKRCIDPTYNGIYTTATMITGYTAYLQLGISNSYARDYPILLGENNKEKYEHLKNATFTAILLVAIAAMCIFSLVGISSGFLGQDPMLLMGILLSAVSSAMGLLVTFLENTYRAENEFNRVASYTLMKSVLTISVCLLCVYLFGYYGLYASLLFPPLVELLLSVKDLIRCKFVWDFKLIISQIKTGFPLLGNSLLWMLMNSVDKVVILSYMSMESLGFYSIATTAFGFVQLVPSTLAQMFYVKMSRAYGEKKDSSALIETGFDFSLINGLTAGAMAVGLYWIISPAVSWILPKYIPGIKAAQVLIMGIAVYATGLIFSNILVILRKNARILFYTAMLCVLNAVFSFSMVIAFGAKIEFVALGSSCAYALYSTVIMIYLFKTMKIPVIKSLFKVWNPVLLLIVPTIILGEVSGFGDMIVNAVIAVSISVAAVLLVYGKKLKKMIFQR